MHHTVVSFLYVAKDDRINESAVGATSSRNVNLEVFADITAHVVIAAHHFENQDKGDDNSLIKIANSELSMDFNFSYFWDIFFYDIAYVLYAPIIFVLSAKISDFLLVRETGVKPLPLNSFFGC